MATTIAICDDNPLIRLALEVFLQEHGYDVVVAADGKSLLDALGRTQPSLLFLDMQMPVLHGMDVLRTLRASGDDRPVVVMSGLAASEDVAEARSLGASAWLTKPFEMEHALQVARALLHEAHAP